MELYTNIIAKKFLPKLPLTILAKFLLLPLTFPNVSPVWAMNHSCIDSEQYFAMLLASTFLGLFLWEKIEGSQLKNKIYRKLG